ncbi:radical SAM protein [Candidatus Contendibacter odensensis]|uniref:Fe-S oxidoreductase n=1 Tax=Candidatus Contendobacter odensis Run_B_J11 TaxID=1400861 RepID=A0A7U7GCP1_9GAMM|nr:radical SAM protein [Candidatus Contendobacter odensis]CDH45717.1 Fe-S oxidoreductase [Candidatus Contendobacter odensis Run_B_J11]
MLIQYDMPVYRPPSEANSFILQVTLGCSFNRCSFCSMYRTKHFAIRPLAEVQAEIAAIARVDPSTQRVFLADGDALAAPVEHLLAILATLHTAFPRLERVSSYALPANLLKKSAAELTRLRENGLTLLYYGIETGSAELLKRITKGAMPEAMVTGLSKAKQAGLKISATVILGLGGQSYWREHIDATADLVNRLELDYLSTLQLMLDPVITEEFHRKFREPFLEQDDRALLVEQVRLIERLNPPVPLVFRSNHASNALALAGELPRDREKLLAQLEQALAGTVRLRPEWMRGY